MQTPPPPPPINWPSVSALDAHVLLLIDAVYMDVSGWIDSSVLCKTITCVTHTDSGLFVEELRDWKQSCCGRSQEGRLQYAVILGCRASVSYITKALWGWHSLWLKCTMGERPLMRWCCRSDILMVHMVIRGRRYRVFESSSPRLFHISSLATVRAEPPWPRKEIKD